MAVTRPEEATAGLTAGLRARGAEVVVHPLIRVAPPEDGVAVQRVAADVASYDWVVFTSVNAVRFFLAALERAGAAMERGSPRVGAVGSATAAALASAGIVVDVVPAEYAGRALPEAMAAQAPLAGARVLLPRSAIGREELPDLLRAAGVRVDDVAVYRTLPDPDGARRLADALADNALDVLTFTSPSAVRCLAGACPHLPRRVRVAAIGPSTAEAARAVGFEVHAVPDVYTSEGLVEAVVRAVRRDI